MVEEERNQSILISGESGSGKSESTKLILRYLASRNGKHSKIEQMLVEISPILESFGNAKTSQNDNSSRFGKFIEVYFGTEKQGLVGAKIVTYLLEKSRIVQQAENERNYHVFYQFIQGASEAERKMYKLQMPQEYNYLNQGNCYTINGVSDAEDFTSLKSGFRFLGFDDQMQNNIFSVLAAILHLGNIKFVKGDKDEMKIANVDVLNFVASMLKLQPEQLSKALCTRKMSVKGSAAVVIPLQLAEANTSRESLAKTLYSQLFAWIVKTINSKIDPPTAESSIGILDIFGFESFQKNSFEQLCINFANEKLAQYFNSYIFKQEQEEYKAQKIDWKNIDFVDNEECVNLIEKKPLGILGILDEECRFPQATDFTFLDKLVKNLAKHPNFEIPKMSKNLFAVNHYAGKVQYTVDGMLEKNKDVLSDDLIEICCHPNAGFTKEIMQITTQQESPANTKDLTLTGTLNRKAGASFNTVGAQFKQQLNELVRALASTTPSFVRCVKPNRTKAPGTFDREMVLTQLKYSGMLETVRIRKAGFGARMTFIDFYDRYKCLCAKMIGKEKVSDEMMCDYLCKALSKMKVLDDNGWQKGKAKIFLKDSQQSRLEEVRVKIYIQKCIVIQKYWKMYSTRKYYKLLKASTVKIQACFRGYRARKRNPLAWKRKQVIKIQTLIRRALCRRRYLGIITIVRKKAEEEAAKRKEEEAVKRRLEEQASEEPQDNARIEAMKPKSAPASPSTSSAKPRPTGMGSVLNLANPPNYNPPTAHLAPMTAPAAQAQFKQIRKESSVPNISSDGLSPQSTPALRALAREASPHSPVDPSRDAGLLATMHRRKETVMPDAMKTMPNLSSTAKQKMFTPSSSEPALPIPSGGTLRRLGETTGITQKVATLHRTHTSSMPTAPIYVRSNSLTPIATSFLEVQPIGKKNAEPPALLKPEEASSYTWAQFFVGFCNRETGDFATKIQSHLLKSSGSYTKACLQLFDYIMELMGDQLAKKSKTSNAMQPFLTTQNLIEIGLKCPDLIDEIFAMICKQITNNPNSPSVEKGWELMAICCCTFAPSASTIKYILAKILSHKGDRANFWPDFCAKNMQRNYRAPARKFVPSIQEISAIKNCAKVKINVAFMAGKHFPVEVESHTTCADVCGVIEGAFNIKHSAQYTIFEVFGELERAISYDERMCDIVAKWELYQTSISSKGLNANFAFYYKRHLFPHPNVEIHDEVEALFTYHQAVFAVVHDHYPLTEDLVLTLAALQLCNDPKAEIRKCISKYWFKNHELAEWDKMINTKSNFLGLRGFNPAMARQVYLQYMTQVSLFGSTFFSVKETDPPRASIVLAINIYGLHLCEPSTKEILKSYTLTQIERWGSSESTFFFRLETDPPTSFSYDTVQGAEICAALSRHCVGLMDATHARAIVDFVGAIQFQTGDVIKISGKDISPGWYSGTTNSKTGLFPVTSVLLGFADIPPLEAAGNFHPQKQSAKEEIKSTHNTYAPKPMKEVDAQKFTFSKYAAANFRTQSSKKGKTIDAASRASYSKIPLEESLLRLSAEYNSIAIAVFEKILKFISESHFTKSVVRIAQDIVQTGIDKADLRDEIYCQLIKQATLNPNTVSFGKVWELLAFCSCCFMPSENLVDYLLAFFQMNTGWQSDAKHLAVDCLRKLQFTLQYGDRVVAPSIWEMQFIMKNKPMVCGVQLPDRTTVDIPIESSTNSEDLLTRVAEKLKIPLDEFQEFYVYTYVPEKKSGFKAIPAAWRSVKSTRKVADLWGAAEKLQLLGGEQPPPALKIRRKFVIGAWPSTVISANPFYCQLEFGQAFEEFVDGKIACSAGEAIVFSVLALQILHGDYDARRKIITTKTIYDYMPKYILDEGGGNVATWVDKINLAHQQLAGKHLSETRTKFLSRVRAWKLYGSSIFKVEQRKKPYVMWMAINQKGIDFLDYPKLQPITQYTFPQILSWNFSKEGEFNLLTGNLQSPTKEYFMATECQEIAELLDTYLQMHQKAEEHARYKSKNMDKTAFTTARTFKTPASQRGSRNSRLAIPKPRNSARIDSGKRTSKILSSDFSEGATAQNPTAAPASPHPSMQPRGVPTPHGGAFAKPAARVANPRSSAASMRFNFKK